MTIRNLDEKDVEVAIDDHNRDIEQKAKEKKTVNISSSEDKESSEEDELSLE